jgi:2-dehydro-3-deoxyglucarate aldolase/4-hydroxy-2-oxoheptanedioate aldolase
MTMASHLKQALATGRVVRVFGVGQLCHPKVVEMVGLAGGFDAVWLDQEHAGLSVEQIELAALAARAAGLDSFVRLAPTDYATVMRPLEAGAGGIMAAQVRSARQAEEVMTWAKFAPRGLRGVNGLGRDGNFGSGPLGDYFRRANEDTFVAIQIEHADAVAEVERIAALPNVDVLFVGPADLAQSMGLAGEWEHPSIWKAIERVAAAARAAGIHWAILPANPAYAKRCTDLGCRMLSIGFDVWAFARGVRDFHEQYAEFFGERGASAPR